MKLVQYFVTKNPCWKNNVDAKALYDSGTDKRYWIFQCQGPKGGMLHSVGCAQPSALVFIKNHWDKEDQNNVCVHGVIDANDGTAYQNLKWNYRGWHGGGSSNNTHIGVEMCESKYIRYLTPGESGYAPGKFVVLDKNLAQADCRRAYNTAVELFAMLATTYHWNVDTDIVSHYEGGQKGIASAHGDPEHYWKGLGMSYTMDGFRADVKKKMKPTMPFVDVEEDRYYYEPVLWAFGNGICNGTDSTHFKPDANCTRGQIVTMLKRYHDKFGGENND